MKRARTLTVTVILPIAAAIAGGIWLTGRGHESAGPDALRPPIEPTPSTTPQPDPGPFVLIVDSSQLSLAPVPVRTSYASLIPLQGGSMLAGDDQNHWQILHRDGLLEPSLPIESYPVLSHDEQFIAWPAPGGLRIYDRGTKTIRQISSAQWIVGELVWSPDDRRISYLRLTGDGVVHMVVLDWATNAEHEIYAGAPGETVGGLRWVGLSEIEFRVYDTASCCTIAGGQIYSPGEGGRRYLLADSGGEPRLVGEGNPLWHFCGDLCGVPPLGFERADGTASWKSRVSDAYYFRWGIVDRAAGVVRVPPRGEASGSYAVSPDGSQIAYVICDFQSDQLLRIVPIAEVQPALTQTMVLPGWANASRVCYDVKWFPDGNSLLLSLAFRNGN
jgi:hypothetical protein